jgi:CHASE3 domain sensor protein
MNIMKRLQESWNNWSLFAKGLLIISLPALLVLVSLLSGYRLEQQTALAEAEAKRTLQVQIEIQALHTGIAESATGVRGYLLTGRDDFLTPYWKAQQQLPFTIERLKSLLRDPEQQQRLARLLPLLEQKLTSLNGLRTQGRYQSPEALRQHLLSSKLILDDLRSEINAMQVREAELVEARAKAVTVALSRNVWMTMVTLIISLLVLVLTLFLFYSSIVQRVRSLAANAEHLARDEPLQTLPVGNDELGQLAARLQATSVLLVQRANEAKIANEAKTAFLSRISHELRTPLNAILGFSQLLSNDTHLPDGQQQHAKHIFKAGRHLLSLVNDLLDIARLEAKNIHAVSQRLAASKKADRSDEAADTRYTLLCIDDNVSNLALIQALIRQRPQWRLFTAASGEAGLDLAEKHHPDLLLLDLHLGDTSGETLLATLQADKPHLPVVIISADAQPETQQQLLSQGARAYLTKPLEVPKFLQLLDHYGAPALP